MKLQIILLVHISGPPGHTGYPGPQAPYPGTQAGYPGPYANYSVPPHGYSGAGPVGFPVQHQPVYNQQGGPAGTPWMPAPPPPSDCPPGLEYLTQVISNALNSHKK